MKPTLPTNYKDDILNTSVEGMRRYQMIYNPDNTVSFKDVTPYDQTGSDFGAGDINATNQAVNESFDKKKLIRDMDAINALTQEGYAPDALALKDVNDSLNNVGSCELLAETQNTNEDNIITVNDINQYRFLLAGISNPNAKSLINPVLIPVDALKTSGFEWYSLYTSPSSDINYSATVGYVSDTTLNFFVTHDTRKGYLYGIK